MIMNMNEKGRQTKLLAAIAVLAMAVCVIAVALPSDAEGTAYDAKTDGPFDFTSEVNYGDYGIITPSSMNDIVVTYDASSKTYKVEGILFYQPISGETAFYKMWTTNTDNHYGIPFNMNLVDGSTISYYDNASQGTKTLTVSNDIQFLLYTDASSDGIFEVTVSEGTNDEPAAGTYTIDYTGVSYIVNVADGYSGNGWSYTTAGGLVFESEESVTVTEAFKGAISTVVGNKNVTLSPTPVITEINKVFGAINSTASTLSISGDLAISMDVDDIVVDGTMNSEKIAAINASQAITITCTSLTINITGSVTGSEDYSEAVYGIRTAASASAVNIGATGDAETKLSINVAENDGLAFAVAYGAQTYTDVSGTITGGNRGIQIGAQAIIFNDATLTITGGEKAIQAKTAKASVTLDNASKITLNLGDAELNTGDNDRFGLKINGTLKLTDADSSLTTAGLAFMEEGIIHNDSAGKITVNGGYSQNPAADMYSPIAGLYNVNFTKAITASTYDNENADIKLANGADTYGNVNVLGETGNEPVSAPATATNAAAAQEAMSNDKVSMVIITAGSYSGTEVVEITKDVLITGTGNTTFNGALASGTSVTVAGGTLTGSISNANNVMTFNAVKGEFTVTYGSVEINGNPESGTISISGETNINGEVGASGNETFTINSAVSGKNQYIEIKDSLTINASSTLALGQNVVLVVPEGKTLTINGTLSVDGGIAIYGTVVFGEQGSVTDGTSKTGAYAVAEGVTVNTTKFSAIDKMPIYVYEDAFGVSNTITGNTEWNTATYLTADITIAEGVTVTIGDKGYLDLCGHDLIVKGTLVISGKGYITDGENNGAVYIGDKGIIDNSGTIGAGKPVTVGMYQQDSKYTGVGSIVIQDVTGVVFGSEKTVNGSNITYTLTISGDISYADRNTASITFNQGTLITGTTEIGRYVDVKGTATLDSGATLTISGNDAKDPAGNSVVRDVDLAMQSNTEFSASGIYTGTVTAKTGVYNTYTNDGAINTEAALQGSSTVTLNNIRGLTYTVSSKTFDVEENVNGKLTTVNKTEQMLSVSGNVSFVDSEKKEGSKMTVTGDVYVFADQTLAFSDDMEVDATKGVIIAEGTVTTINTEIANYKGAMYSVENTENDNITYTYTDFVTAFGQIATAEDNTVYLMGGYEFTGEIEVSEDQIIQFTDGAAPGTSGDIVKYTIASDAKITVAEGGTIEGETSSIPVFYKIDGILVVMDGGECTPAEGSYEVTSTDEDDNVTYTSAATAIRNATAGTTVNIVNDAVLDSAVTIQNGVTVEIADTGSLTANKGITVAEGGKIVNEGTLTVADEYDLVVAGEVQSTEGTIELKGTESEMTVTGTVTVSTQVSRANGAWYNADGAVVYTTVAKAVAAVTAMDVKAPITAVGTFTETGTVVLTQGMKVTVNGSAVTLGTVEVQTGANLEIKSGTLTATVTGACGTDGTASVDLVKAENLAFTVTYNNSNSTSTFTVKALDNTNKVVKGTVGVATGTVTVSGELSFDGKDGALSVASGATINVPADAKITAEDDEKNVAVKVDGTMDVVEGTLNITSGAYVEVSGTLNVSESPANAGVQIAGTLTVTGTANISAETGETGNMVVLGTGVLIVGQKPTALGAGGAIVGAVDTPDSGTAGYIKAYAGADMSGAVIDVATPGAESAADSLEFYINGSLYMTVISENNSVFAVSTSANAVLTAEDFTLTGYLVNYRTTTDPVSIKNVCDWYTGADMSENVPESVNSLTNYDAIYFKAISATVDVKVSVGTGISLYIDNIKMTSGTSTELTVGTHTVTATIDPGYKGDVTIQFNGQTVTGSFTITPEMASAAYEGVISVTATGNITQDSTVVVDGGSSGDGMGLTDYLLIILVVLIVVMAIMVAMRLMRS